MSGHLSRREFLRLSSISPLALAYGQSLRGNPTTNNTFFHYHDPRLTLDTHQLTDALGTIALRDLADIEPEHPARLQGVTPFTEKLWRVALGDIEFDIVHTQNGRYLSAGEHFGRRLYTRDISFAGLLGVNCLYPELMRSSLKTTRKVRFQRGFQVAQKHAVREIDVDWQELDLNEWQYLKTYHTNSYTRHTDDVVWLWCAADLAQRSGLLEDWQWIYTTGTRCFGTFYWPFYDKNDGLFWGQASCMDIHYIEFKATGYPQSMSLHDCVLIKALSTNCLYVKGMEVMARAAAQCARPNENQQWQQRADQLRIAIRENLRRPDGTFAYFKGKHGTLQDRRDALGTALAVLTEVVTGDASLKACRDYPVTDNGVPVFVPFFDHNQWYHNHSSRPFIDTLFIKALEKVDGRDRTALNAALLARSCRKDGTFHEVTDFRTKHIKGSGKQLCTAAAFIDTCRRAGILPKTLV